MTTPNTPPPPGTPEQAGLHMSGSEGMRMEQTAPFRYRVTLAPSRGFPLVPNMLQFRCTGCARDALEIEVHFPVPKPRGLFDEYAHAATANFQDYLPLEWEHPANGTQNILRIPATGWDGFHVGMQALYPAEQVEIHVREWARHPHARMECLGTSLQGRDILALRIHDPASAPRWRHWVANQHPGEANARWRIHGMIQELLSDSPAATRLRKNAEILFVPLLCPDGPANGWRRVNADGIDMNRCHRMDGPDPASQTREAFFFQEKLERERPHTLWNMHTWPGLTEPVLDGAGPELAERETRLFTAFQRFAHTEPPLLKALRKREQPGDPTTWNGGAHRRLGITTFLIEGGGGPAQPAPHLRAGAALAEILAECWD